MTTNNAIGSTALQTALTGKIMNSQTYNQLFNGNNPKSFITMLENDIGKLGKVGSKIQNAMQSPTEIGKLEEIGKTVSIGVAVAGAVSKSDDSGEEGFFDRLGKKFNGLQQKITTPLNKGFDKLDSAVSGKPIRDAMNSGDASQGATNNSPVGQGEESTKSSVNVSGAGSVAVNIVNGQTSALTDGAKITLVADADKQEKGSFTSTAADDVFIGAWGGAAAIN